MISLLPVCLLLVNAVTSLAVPEQDGPKMGLKIISPAPGTQVNPGLVLNVTLQIGEEWKNNSQQVVLGFGMNSAVSDQTKPTALGEVFLGLLNTTLTPFNSSGMLTWSLTIPAREKFNSSAHEWSLVVSQYMFSGASHVPHCGLVSVPVKVASQGGGAGGAGGKGPDGQAWKPAGPMGKMGSPASDPTMHKAGSPGPMMGGSMNTSATAGKPMPKSQPPASEVKASIIAKGHNTAETIPATAAAGQSSGPASPKMNTTTTSTPPSSSSPAAKKSPAAAASVPPVLPKKNGTATSSSDSDSAALHLAFSTSHLVAVVAVIVGIFATA